MTNTKYKGKPYTRIDNEIFEKIMSLDLRASELKVILSMVRKISGFNKTEDRISISQISEMTNLARRTVIYAQAYLCESKVIHKLKRGNAKGNANLWEINANTAQWELVQRVALVQSTVTTSAQLSMELVQHVAPTKEINKSKKEIEVNSEKRREKLIQKFPRFKYLLNPNSNA